MKLNFNFSEKNKQKLTKQEVDSLYIKGILAYLNQAKKTSTNHQLKNTIRTANSIQGLEGVFIINEELEIVFEEL